MLFIPSKNHKNLFFSISSYLANSFLLLTLIILISFISSPVLAQEETSPNPFANFETIKLPNGLKVWYKYLPNEANVSVSITVPWGADQDPAGKEELAHFTEHMLFSDHLGRSEEQIKKEVEDLGGVRNGLTYPDRTFYFVRIDKQYGLFAMDWLYKIISPHAMEENIVEKQREPVAIEVGARKRELFDWINAYYFNPPFLSQPDFWAREFGKEAFPMRDYYYYGSLYKITAQDLKNFYETYYTPEGMTLAVIGNLERNEVLNKINSTFANLPSRPRYKSSIELKNPGRYWQSYAWDVQSTAFYSHAFKLYNPNQEQSLKLIFVSHFLQNRLNAQLRFGDRKATYGLGIAPVQRGLATTLQISGNLKESEYNFAYEVIEKELNSLRNATLKNEDFETEKAAITRKLRVAYNSPKDLEQWVANSFYNPERYQDFPDIVTIFEKFTKKDIEEFAKAYLVKNHEVLYVKHVQPLSQEVYAIVILVVILLTVEISRRYLMQPLPMAQIRYIARFKMPLLTRLITWLGLLIFVAIGARLFIFLCESISYRFILHIENFWIQWLTSLVMTVIALLLFMLLLASLPSKVLLFTDSLAIKYFFYRALRIPISEIKEVSLQKFSDIWLSKKLWRCLPLTFALRSPGIYIKLNNNKSYFFQIRNKTEFLEVFAQVRQAKEQVTEKA